MAGCRELRGESSQFVDERFCCFAVVLFGACGSTAPVVSADRAFGSVCGKYPFPGRINHRGFVVTKRNNTATLT